MAAPKLPVQPPTPMMERVEKNSENIFHSKKQIEFKAIKEEVRVYVWELPVRIFHWVNALAIVLLVITGLYIGRPLMGAGIPEEAYYSNLMGWMRYVHFFTAFLFTINLMFRLYWVVIGNKFTKSNPFRWVFWKEVLETINDYRL